MQTGGGPRSGLEGTCAVQMLEVALSRRMCCSRVCIAMRSAGLPGYQSAESAHNHLKGSGIFSVCVSLPTETREATLA